jgi:hypothetical protein
MNRAHNVNYEPCARSEEQKAAQAPASPEIQRGSPSRIAFALSVSEM